MRRLGLRDDLRETYAPCFHAEDDPGNPYQHLLDADEEGIIDNVNEERRLGLSVFGMRCA